MIEKLVEEQKKKVIEYCTGLGLDPTTGLRIFGEQYQNVQKQYEIEKLEDAYVRMTEIYK